MSDEIDTTCPDCGAPAHACCTTARINERHAIATHLETWALAETGAVRLALQAYARDIRKGDHSPVM